MDRRDKNDEKAHYKRWKGKRTKCKDVLTAKEVDDLEEAVEPFKLSYDYFGEPIGSEHIYVEYREDREPMRESDQRRLEREREERAIEFERRRAVIFSEEASRRRQELASSRVIDVSCRSCGHSHEFRFTPEARARLAGKRFVCTKCGHKSAPFLPAA